MRWEVHHLGARTSNKICARTWRIVLWPCQGNSVRLRKLPLHPISARQAVATSSAFASIRANLVPFSENSREFSRGRRTILLLHGVKTHRNRAALCYLTAMNLLLIIIVLLLLFGGGGFYFGGPVIGGSGLGLILLICLIIWAMVDSARKANRIATPEALEEPQPSHISQEPRLVEHNTPCRDKATRHYESAYEKVSPMKI